LDERLRKVEVDMREVLSWKDGVDADLYNHGQDGLKTKFTKFMAEHEATEKARTTMAAAQEAKQAERHKQNRERLNIAIGILLLIAAYLTLIQPLIFRH
jgi:hypothetical protein